MNDLKLVILGMFVVFGILCLLALLGEILKKHEKLVEKIFEVLFGTVLFLACIFFVLFILFFLSYNLLLNLGFIENFIPSFDLWALFKSFMDSIFEVII